MGKARVWWVSAAALAWFAPGAYAVGNENPGCTGKSVKECLELSVEAMGGRDRLEHVKSVRLETTGHTLLMEQSYRQAPFITSYESDKTIVDIAGQRLYTEAKVTWPESDPNQWANDAVLVVAPEGGVYRGKAGDTPCSLSDIDAARETLALGPISLLATAASAPDAHFEAPSTLRSTLHTVVAFTWRGAPVRVLLNPFNHLPDAVETVREFHDFWYFWGDVQQRIYFDNWKVFEGVVYPTNLIDERNGTVWSSSQALSVEFNVPIDPKTFAVGADAAKQSLVSKGWNRPFVPKNDTLLAPDITLFPGAWNSTIVKQADGIVILEAPISGLYTQGVIEEAKKRYPGTPVKAVLSTSDSWPHTGGVRAAVALGLPIYVLDLNQSLLDRMVAARHALDPDALEAANYSKPPQWRLVAGEVEVGTGPNRMELYPLRGASTDRQYMVYFPEHRVLYASDTLALNDDGSLYDPELMREVVRAVTHANLSVETVFAMHQGPMRWDAVMALVEKAQQPVIG